MSNQLENIEVELEGEVVAIEKGHYILQSEDGRIIKEMKDKKTKGMMMMMMMVMMMMHLWICSKFGRRWSQNNDKLIKTYVKLQSAKRFSIKLESLF